MRKEIHLISVLTTMSGLEALHISTTVSTTATLGIAMSCTLGTQVET